MYDDLLTTRQVVEIILVDEDERSRLFAYAASRFGICRADAEDVIQDTALVLLRQRGFVRKPAAFVHTVFRARCSRFVSGQKATRDGLSATLRERLETIYEAGSLDRQLALYQALSAVSVTCRRLIAAYYGEGQTLKKAGKGLPLADSSVPKTIRRCLKKLRKHLTCTECRAFEKAKTRF